MSHAHLAIRAQSQLLVIDIQEKLAAAMEANAMLSLVRNCSILLQAAQLLEIPVTYTEQYPQGLGSTLHDLSKLTPDAAHIEKIAFSAQAVPEFRQSLDVARRQIILTGMEAHICVLQTALDMQQQGYQVILAEDAVLSRNPLHKDNAMHRLRQAGIMVSNTESIVFEWLGVAEGETFKAISRLVR